MGKARNLAKLLNGGVDIADDFTVNNNAVWNAGNDGSGSNLDADVLDGQQGTHYRINVYDSSGSLLN